MTQRIALDNVTVAYHHQIALQGVNFSLPPGVVVGLVGMNGSGKSTLLKTIMGFIRPKTGRVWIEGLPVAVAQKRGWLAYLPQSEQVDWRFPVTVQDVVMMGRYGYMNAWRVPRAIDWRIVQASLQQVDMWELRHRPIGELSGGQKKRAFLARALAQQAPILLLDEPFNGVDGPTEQAMRQLLLELRGQGHTILVATHDLKTVAAFCDQVILINKTVLAYGATPEVVTPENLHRVFGVYPLEV
ncbi:MAG: metal ABC transporter ATP-binding protein [Gloeomargarita sp. SKYBB_i_bin120]|nr:metal ABC transporter ATP-binding protein [Gloeomargarita sp. SKYG98]MCS7292035.1 metal ABC transporter ATP-binding protein [Gloeomargarita sp. SKYB120]MDW8177595.1 metal ABC transporter ATP-binding protein [Gloeomargarita sp. SKYBB_i_bin120]